MRRATMPELEIGDTVTGYVDSYTFFLGVIVEIKIEPGSTIKSCFAGQPDAIQPPYRVYRVEADNMPAGRWFCRTELEMLKRGEQ